MFIENNHTHKLWIVYD